MVAGDDLFENSVITRTEESGYIFYAEHVQHVTLTLRGVEVHPSCNTNSLCFEVFGFTCRLWSS